MEDKKVLEIVKIHSKDLQLRGVPIKKYSHDSLSPMDSYPALAHCHSMLNGIVEFISSGDKEKRDRALIRLGFVQGSLWTIGLYTVDQLKEFNRPDEGTINSQTHEPLANEDLQDWEY